MNQRASEVCWPETLPLPTLSGYQIVPGEAIIRTDMESGPARARRRFTQVPSQVKVRWLMRADQFALFEGWYRWQAKEGGAWFKISLLGGMGLLSQQARFTQAFEAQCLSGVLWEIHATLEVRERPVLEAGILALLLTEDPQGLIAAAEALHRLVQYQLSRYC